MEDQTIHIKRAQTSKQIIQSKNMEIKLSAAEQDALPRASYGVAILVFF